MTDSARNMMLLLDGNSEIGAHLRSDIVNLICSMHLIRSRAVSNLKFIPEKPFFLHTCAICFELPSNISTIAIIDLPRSIVSISNITIP